MQGQQTLKHILRVDEVPTLPEVIHRILAISGDPAASMRQLTEVVSQDLALTANVIRLVNSAYFGFSRPIHNIHQAGVLLGFQSIRSLSLGTSVIQQFSGPKGVDERSFWRHSLAVATVATGLCERGHHSALPVAFLSGLLTDLGVLLLALHNPEVAQEVYSTQDGEPVLLRERAAFGIDHATLGAELADHWHLGSTLTAGIGGHHLLPDEGLENQPELARILYLSEYLVAETHPLDGAPLAEPNAHQVAISLGWQEAQIEEVMANCARPLEQVDAFITVGASAS